MTANRDLNQQQMAAVHHAGGPMRIIAGAGTGKTQTLIRRFAHLVESGIREDRILCLTYSRKAAGELERRIASALGRHGNRSLWIRTFHSFSLRLIDDWNREHHLPAPRVVDADQQLALIRHVVDSIPDDALHAHTGDLGRQKLVSTLSSFSDQVRDLIMSPDDVDRYAREAEALPGRLHDLALAHRRYVEMQHARGLFDYASMGYIAVQRLRSDPQLLERTRNRFDAILIDEFQDANHAQFELMRLLDPDGSHLCVVGDGNQAIYGFRGGRSQYMGEFDTSFPGTKTYELATNYRSGQPILDVANTLIRHNSSTGLLELRADDASRQATITVTQTPSPEMEAAHIVRSIVAMTRRQASPVRYTEIAILLRSTERNAAIIERALAAHGIPFRTAGDSLADAEAVRDVLAALRLIAGPARWSDAARLTAAQHPTTPVALRQIESMVVDPEDLAELLHSGQIEGYVFSVAQNAALAACRGLISEGASHRALPLPELMYQALLLSKRLTEGLDEETARTMQQFLDQATTTAESGGTVEELVRHLSAGYDDLPWHDRFADEGVTILTVHAAKGLEWPVVFVPAMAGGEFPLPMKIDRDFDPDILSEWRTTPRATATEKQRRERFLQEERRLAYVALTRAQSELHISWPQASNSGGHLRPSQFIAEANLPVPETPLAPDRSPLPVSTSDLARMLRTLKNDALITTLADSDVARKLSGLLLEQSAAITGTAGARPLRDRLLPRPFSDGRALRLSFSQLNRYESCPRSYFYERALGLADDEESHYLTFGSVVHAALHDLNEEWRVSGTVPRPSAIAPAIDRNWPEKGFMFEGQARQLRQRAEAMLQRYYGWEASRELPRRPRLTEQSFQVSYGPHTISGRIDAVLESSDGSVEIVDYKTSKRNSSSIGKPAESLQLFLYDYALRIEDPDEQPSVAFYALRHDSDRGFATGPVWDERQIRQHIHTDESRLPLTARIDEIIAGIAANTFAPTPSSDACRGCAFRWICPEGDSE